MRCGKKRRGGAAVCADRAGRESTGLNPPQTIGVFGRRSGSAESGMRSPRSVGADQAQRERGVGGSICELRARARGRDSRAGQGADGAPARKSSYGRRAAASRDRGCATPERYPATTSPNATIARSTPASSTSRWRIARMRRSRSPPARIIHEPRAESARCASAARRSAGRTHLRWVPRNRVVHTMRTAAGRASGYPPKVGPDDAQIALAGGGLVNDPG